MHVDRNLKLPQIGRPSNKLSPSHFDRKLRIDRVETITISANEMAKVALDYFVAGQNAFTLTADK